jgi:hypothetical protein
MPATISPCNEVTQQSAGSRCPDDSEAGKELAQANRALDLTSNHAFVCAASIMDLYAFIGSLSLPEASTSPVVGS